MESGTMDDTLEQKKECWAKGKEIQMKYRLVNSNIFIWFPSL